MIGSELVRPDKASLPEAPTAILASKAFVVFFNVIFLFLTVPNLVRFWENPFGYQNKLFSQRFMFIALMVLFSVASLSQWSLFCLARFRTRKDSKILSDQMTDVDSVMSNVPLVPSYSQICLKVPSVLEDLAILSCTLLFSIVLIYRSAAPTCQESFIRGLLPDWHCNPYGAVPVFPMDTAFLLMLFPSYYALAMKQKKLSLSVVLSLIIFFSLIVSAYVVQASHQPSAFIILIYTVGTSCVLLDTYKLHSYIIELMENLKASLTENDRLRDEKRMSEMKDVIGNVAHDLKTVMPTISVSCFVMIIYLPFLPTASFFIYARSGLHFGLCTGVRISFAQQLVLLGTRSNFEKS